MPGVWCEQAGAHTEGSMNVIVETAEGLACICGDVIYDFNDQIVNHVHTNNWMEPRYHRQPLADQARGEGGDQEAAEQLPLPAADPRPAGQDRARSRSPGRLGMQVPGPVTETVPARNWFPA